LARPADGPGRGGAFATSASDFGGGKEVALSEDELALADGKGGFAMAGRGRAGLETPGALGEAVGDFNGVAGVFLSAAIEDDARGKGGGGGGGTAGRCPIPLARWAFISAAISGISLAGFQAEKPSLQP
jgi:hypothetical protein